MPVSTKTTSRVAAPVAASAVGESDTAMTTKRKMAITALGFVLLLVAGYSVLYVASVWRLNAARARIPFPASDSFATASPVYAAVFQKMAAVSNGPRSGQLVRSGPSPHVYPPEVFEQFPRLLSESQVLVATSRVSELVADTQSLISDIRAASETDSPMGVLDASEGYGLVVRDMGTMLNADAHVGAAGGDVERVVTDVLAMMRLGDAAAEAPTIINQAVRIHLYRTAFTAVSELLPADNISHEQRQRLIDQLAGGQHREAAISMLAGEAAQGANKFANVRDGGVVEIYSRNIVQHVLLQAYVDVYRSIPGRPLVYLDEAQYLEFMADVQELAGMPYSMSALKLPALEARRSGLPFFYFIARQVDRSYMQLLEDQAWHEAYVAVALLGLAVEDYYEEFGTYPNSAEDIARRLPRGIPTDPFSGKPYYYQPATHSFDCAEMPAWRYQATRTSR